MRTIFVVTVKERNMAMANCENCIKSDVCKYYEPKSTVACERYSASVLHGHWIAEYDCGYITPHCSECGETALTKEKTSYDYVYSSYCPRCGARMDGNDVE